MSRRSSGCVLAAHHSSTQQDVVIKIRAHDDRSADVEMQALRHVSHPNVVELITAGKTGDTDYLVLSLVPGKTLTQWLKERPPTDDAAFRGIIEGLADALDAIHAAGFIHRDLKPANIIIRPDNAPAIIDFHAADRIGEAVGGPLSELTPGYAAPEQYEIDGREGPWTDIYGLGAVAYRIVTGAEPPDARERSGGNTALSAFDRADRRYSPELLQTIDSALSLDEFSRPASGAAFKDASQAESPNAKARPDDPDDAPTRRIQRLPDLRPKPRQMRPTSPQLDRRRWPPWLRRTGQALAALIVLVGIFLAWNRPPNEIQLSWVVDPTGLGDTTTIGEALRGAPVGATIVVRPGDYPETLIVDRPVSVVGPGDGSARILPENGPCVIGNASHGLIRGLLFGSAATDTPTACVVLSNAGLAIDGNIFADRSGPAITVRGEARPLLRRNEITRISGPGILFEAGANGTAVANEIEQTTEPGIIVSGGADPTIGSNTISETQQAGLLFEEGAGGLAIDNDILGSSASGIELRHGARPTVRGNRIQAGRQSGVYAYASAAGLIVDNVITDNAFSGVIIEAAAPVLAGNEIRDNAEHGVLVVRGSGAIIGNKIVNNAGHGVAMTLDADTEIENNELSGNQDPQTQRGVLSGTE